MPSRDFLNILRVLIRISVPVLSYAAECCCLTGKEQAASHDEDNMSKDNMPPCHEESTSPLQKSISDKDNNPSGWAACPCVFGTVQIMDIPPSAALSVPVIKITLAFNEPDQGFHPHLSAPPFRPPIVKS